MQGHKAISTTKTKLTKENHMNSIYCKELCEHDHCINRNVIVPFFQEVEKLPEKTSQNKPIDLESAAFTRYVQDFASLKYLELCQI